MTQELEIQDTDLRNWFEQDDIFYRPEDKRQFFNSIEVIVNGGQGIAVLADSEHMLNHYCRLMSSRLRQLRGLDFEVLLPSTTNSLLKRFNRIMAKMSLDDALRPAKPDSTKTLMVVNDAHLIEHQQWILLSQLIADFPGVNISLVVFINSEQWSEYEEVLILFNQGLHRWILNKPSKQDIDLLKKVASQAGCEAKIEKLLKEITEEEFEEQELLNINEKPCETNDINTLTDGNLELEQPDDTAVKTSSESLGKPYWGKVKFPLVASGALLSALLIGTLMMTQSDRGNYYLDKVLEIGVNTNKSYVTDELDVFTQKISFEQSPKEVTETRHPIPTTQKNSRNSAVEASKKATPQEIISSARPDSYFVQFNLFQERITAEAYRTQNIRLATALLVDMQLGQRTIYGVISGPFGTREKAQKFVEAAGMPEDYWIKTAQALKLSVTKT
jgi:hypothetical protein